MATHTLAATGLTAVTFSPTPQVLLPADLATINAGIKNDQNAIGWPDMNTSFGFNGLLHVPNRGQLKVYPGDVVAFDAQTGGVIVVTAKAIAGGAWTLV
jgi:hypothetical protein